MKTVYYVARVYNFVQPAIVEKFENKTDAETYAAIMCRTKKASYQILEAIDECIWENEQQNQ